MGPRRLAWSSFGFVALSGIGFLQACSGTGTTGADQPTRPTAASTSVAIDSTTTTLTRATDSTVNESTATAESPTTIAATTTRPPTTTTSAPESTTTKATGRVVTAGLAAEPLLEVVLRFESRVDDVTSEEFAVEAMTILTDDRGWGRGGFEFVEGNDTALLVVLGEGPEIDAICLPLQTRATVSCQNGEVVGLNADRWRTATDSWDSTVEDYRIYLVNHEVGHLIGMRHPTPRCPTPGAPAAVMEPQTGGLVGCVGNGWPRGWEIDYALARPAVIGPLPDWAPEPVPANLEPSG